MRKVEKELALLASPTSFADSIRVKRKYFRKESEGNVHRTAAAGEVVVLRGPHKLSIFLEKWTAG